MSEITCPFKYEDKSYCAYYLCDYPAKEIIGDPGPYFNPEPIEETIRKHMQEVYKAKFGCCEKE